MPTSAYQQALDIIDPVMRTRIEAGVAALDVQLQINIGNETALAINDFVVLLQQFDAELIANPAESAQFSWTKACRAHPLKGNIVPEPHWPIVLGRWKTLESHARHIANIPDAGFGAAEAEELLRKHAKSASLPDLIDLLQDAVLGDYTLWATFDPTDSKKSPFLRLPQTHAGICAALAVEYKVAMVALTWNHQKSGAPPLHRPTIADAAENILFRPYHDPASHCGYTGQLAHTPALEPQPELVLKKITCKGLILPYIIFETLGV